MIKNRLDQELVKRELASTRSQAENYIRLGQVKVNGRTVAKPGFFVNERDTVEFLASEQYVSRAGLKLASIASSFGLDFAGKTVLDVGSSTGGFTDYALQHGAVFVYAVDVGTDQLHDSLRIDERVELHEQTDIRDFIPVKKLDLVVIDVSFISLREILPHIASLCGPQTQVVAMCKPQFESGAQLKNRGVVKNDRMRRDILQQFEHWTKKYFVVQSKADSAISGAYGNRERFYLLSLPAG